MTLLTDRLKMCNYSILLGSTLLNISGQLIVITLEVGPH